jgi:coenzyme F420 hydrogenase subunit beta
LGFVGTPCHVQAIRKIEAVPLKKYSNPIKFVLGLMCTESFDYSGLVENYLQNKLGINPAEVEKMNIKGKIIVTLSSGETKEVSLAEVKQFIRRGCLFCDDFSSQLADISLGGLGLNNWTFTLIRTEKGEQIFREAEKQNLIRTKTIGEQDFPLKLLIKLSKIKRKRKLKSEAT